jgi:hypothetical protein
LPKSLADWQSHGDHDKNLGSEEDQGDELRWPRSCPALYLCGWGDPEKLRPECQVPVHEDRALIQQPWTWRIINLTPDQAESPSGGSP